MARFKAERADLTAIVVYIPHKGRYDTPINQSSTYNELEHVISTVSKHDCLIVMSDFNSRLARSDKTNNYMDKDLIDVHDHIKAGFPDFVSIFINSGNKRIKSMRVLRN